MATIFFSYMCLIPFSIASMLSDMIAPYSKLIWTSASEWWHEQFDLISSTHSACILLEQVHSRLGRSDPSQSCNPTFAPSRRPSLIHQTALDTWSLIIDHWFWCQCHTKNVFSTFYILKTSLIKFNTQNNWPSSMVKITNGRAQCSRPSIVELNAWRRMQYSISMLKGNAWVCLSL